MSNRYREIPSAGSFPQFSGTTMVGAVVTFPEGTTREEAQTLLDQLMNRGAINRSKAREYCEEDGSPVWYIP